MPVSRGHTHLQRWDWPLWGGVAVSSVQICYAGWRATTGSFGPAGHLSTYNVVGGHHGHHKKDG